MKGKVNSLNASVAAGILIYKIFEKRNWYNV
jgi:tRNA G18 (ribose-2'-O)-methylase SpoU